MRLDVLIPTYRRPGFLKMALQSVVTAAMPDGLSVGIIIVDNDGGGPDLEQLCRPADTNVSITFLRESRPGKSHALNTGIASSSADYVGLIDDDELLDPQWLNRVSRELQDGGLDFIGGPAVPIWSEGPPPWLPRAYPAVLGMVDSGPIRLPYGHEFPGMLTGGNAVVARRWLTALGGFSPSLGPRPRCRLFSCEDEDLYWRLVDGGARGLYVPDLVVYHHVHPDRVSRSYFRRWVFWNGVSKAVAARGRPSIVRQFGRVPRYLYRRGLRGLAAWSADLVLRRPASVRLADELAVWELVGFVYGRYFYPDDPARRRGARSEPGSDRTGRRRADDEAAAGVAAG